MTAHTQTVLRALLGKTPDGSAIPGALEDGVYGLELSQVTGLATGTLFPLLERLIQSGWVERYWEGDEAAEAAGRTRRRYYRLSASGAASARLALAEAMASGKAAPYTPRRRATVSHGGAA
ncbi:Transcriptional regulator PadR-like family protein [Streptomyces sp. TLI_053]|uniref:PadR family transcriptional regulator n=1 Tax=Streptomyces sp. TLI_053 TaxID=1855352 RepID=UPI00087DC134|nr:helix-turn-helix transcriptional regulator [Streptomyces sp. TLI_053]SDS49578.1 Transcriptional regulator PadR-like family protein [Streptomyces sp. TLI_053]